MITTYPSCAKKSSWKPYSHSQDELGGKDDHDEARLKHFQLFGINFRFSVGRRSLTAVTLLTTFAFVSVTGVMLGEQGGKVSHNALHTFQNSSSNDKWNLKDQQRQCPVNFSSPAGEHIDTAFGETNLPGQSPNYRLSSLLNQALLLCVAITAFTVWLTYKIFGTNGLRSINGKKEYIPSQYRKAHKKIMKELAPCHVGGIPLGTRLEWAPWLPWEQKELGLPPSVRNKEPHILLLGIAKKGKTRLMANLIAHDIESNDRAIVVIDSNGNLIDLLTRWISAHPDGQRIADRVVYLDPTNKNGTVAYNPLELPENGDLQGVANALVDGFKSIYTENPGTQTQWNAQTANVLRNSALLLMANGKTLADLPTLLQDNDFRDNLLDNIAKMKNMRAEYIAMSETWNQYKKLARTEQWITWVEPILNRVGAMLSDPRIRPLLTKNSSDFKFSNVIEEKKILFVKVAKGQLDGNANLLGSLIVTGLKQAAVDLSGKAKSKASSLYLDEFDRFIGQETLDSITKETDRYKIGFVGAMKTLQQLPEDFRNQLTIAIGTVACFALTKKDGDLLGPQMFRVDGRKIKFQTMANFFNPINSSPQFEYISDEAILNIDRLVGQDERNFFCYRNGTQAGVFHLKSHDFNGIGDSDVDRRLIEQMKNNLKAEKVFG